jgi:UTP-glucose-1-phosphate uridylyltransferase
VFEKLNFTSPTDPAKINYSKEDCQYIVDEGRNRTAAGIRRLPNASDCVKNVLEDHFLDIMLLKSALDKKNRKEDGSRILMDVWPRAMKSCNETMKLPN